MSHEPTIFSSRSPTGRVHGEGLSSATSGHRGVIPFKIHESDGARLAKMRTSIGLQERAQSALVERRFVPMADGQVCWCELAFLLTTQRKLYPRRAALSSSSQEPRIAAGRRAQEQACADVQDGSYIANARGRPRSRTHGRGNDTRGSRRENVDNEECCFTRARRDRVAPSASGSRRCPAREDARAGRASNWRPRLRLSSTRIRAGWPMSLPVTVRSCGSYLPRWSTRKGLVI